MTSVDANDIHVAMETMSERLKWARKKAGFASANAAATEHGWVRSSYAAHENGQNNFKEKAAKTYGKAFGVSWSWLLTGRGTPEPTADELAAHEGATASKAKPNASFPPRHQRLGSDRSIPLLGQTIGGPNGRFVLNGQTIGSVFSPPDLLNVDEAYAVRIYGTSMEPRYKAGETVWLNPHEPVRAGDDVVVQILRGDDELPESYIKEFVFFSSKALRLRQLNPDEGEEELLEFPASRVFSVHKVVFHAKA